MSFNFKKKENCKIMPQTWMKARKLFSFEYDLRKYDNAQGRQQRLDYRNKHKDIELDVANHKGFFQLYGNDLSSNTALEVHFQQHAKTTLEAYYEILFWKTQMVFRASRMINNLRDNNTSASDLFAAGESFIEKLDQESFANFTKLCGISGSGLAVPSAILCFINPKKMPIVDMWVARWVNVNHRNYEGLAEFEDFNQQCIHKQEIIAANALTERANRRTKPQPIVRMNDFEAYRKWVLWTRKFAGTLTVHTKTNWRARDVEMAVFAAAQDQNIIMNNFTKA